MLFPGFALFPNMTLEENIRLALQAGGHKILEHAARRNRSGAAGTGSAGFGMGAGVNSAGATGSGANGTGAPEDSKASKKHKDKEFEFKSYDLAVVDTTVNEFLHEYHLDGLGGEYPDQLQGAQKLWAALARMMAGDPKVVLLDEPFKDLDHYRRASVLMEVRDLLREKKVQGVFVSSDRDEAYAMSEYISVLEKGKNREAQKRDAFFQHPLTIGSALLAGVKNVANVSLTDECHALAADWGILFSFPWEDPDAETSKDAVKAENKAESETEKKEQKQTEQNSAEQAGQEADKPSDDEQKPKGQGTKDEDNQGAEAVSDVSKEAAKTTAVAVRVEPAAGGNTNGRPAEPAHPKWQKLPKDLKAVGIDSRDFEQERPKDEDGKEKPCYKFSVYLTGIEEDIENWNVSFRTLTREDAGNLIWTVPKKQIKREEIENVKHLYVANDRILRLQ